MVPALKLRITKLSGNSVLWRLSTISVNKSCVIEANRAVYAIACKFENPKIVSSYQYVSKHEVGSANHLHQLVWVVPLYLLKARYGLSHGSTQLLCLLLTDVYTPTIKLLQRFIQCYNLSCLNRVSHYLHNRQSFILCFVANIVSSDCNHSVILY
jgi:hypothetical protein